VNSIARLIDRARPLPDASRLHAGSRIRWLAFAAPVLGAAGSGTWLGWRLTQGEADPLRWPLLGLLGLILLYQAMVGWPGVLGGLLRLLRKPPMVAAQPAGRSRTAILFPIYNEDPHAVFTAVAVMARALADHGRSAADIHVLSDTRDPAIAAAERDAVARLGASGVTVQYRRRTANAGRKAGNIADWCASNGTLYDYMLVLDADSLMSAATVTTLIGLMDANPRAGLIQTVPYPVGRVTLFARIQQFAARLYTPLLVEGLAYWQGADGNYWGHNAIIRIAPFMAHCTLPILPGREPFGGEILCHDVVEAALMQRAGWDVWMTPTLGASYEALPANIVDYAQRERRWCQGNLQHIGVLGAPRLRPVGRYHMVLGVLCYLSGPLTAAFMALATLDGVIGGRVAEALLATPGWERTALVLLVLFLLYGAKLASLAAALLDNAASEAFGGRLRLLASAVLEQAAAMVICPVMLMFYTRYVVMMLLGRAVQWDAQPRDDRGVSWAEAWRRMRLPAIAGTAWLAGLSMVGGPPLAWALSLIAGLAVATPFAVWSSRTSLGILAQRLGLFLTEDEVSPHPVLRAYQRAMAGQAVHPPGAGRLPAAVLTLQAAAERD
jgi:membrane glycosyltransferase